MMKRTLTAVIAGAVLAFGLSAQPAAAAKTKLTIAIGFQDANNLDPHRSPSVVDEALFNMMFDGLVRIKPGEASPKYIEPDLATSWTSNAKGTEWTFKLRHGVQCHHGYGELTSADIVYSLERAADPKRSSFAGDFAAMKSVTAIDKYTVKVTFKYPIPGVLGLLSNYHGGNIVCKKAAEKMGADFNKMPIGTGPFMFAEYKPQEYTRLVANDKYFRGAPKIKEIVYRYIPSDASRDLAFASGEVDMIFGKQDQKWIERTKKVPGAVVAVMEPAELSTLYLNITKKPLNDIRVRKAIAYAIDRKRLVQLKGKTANRAAKSVVPIGYLGYTSDVPLLPYDPAKAKSLLKEAGYPHGVTLKSIHTTLPILATTMEGVQAQLREVGINLEIKPVEHSTWHSLIRKDLSPVVLYAAARFPVADVYLTQFFDSKSIVNTPTGVTNFSHCKVADAEIEGARRATNPARQKKLWKIAQQKIVADVCGIPLIEALQVWAYKKDLDLGYALHGNLNLAPPITEKTHFTD